jgi:hypothetical protein
MDEAKPLPRYKRCGNCNNVQTGTYFIDMPKLKNCQTCGKIPSEYLEITYTKEYSRYIANSNEPKGLKTLCDDY